MVKKVFASAAEVMGELKGKGIVRDGITVMVGGFGLCGRGGRGAGGGFLRGWCSGVLRSGHQDGAGGEQQRGGECADGAMRLHDRIPRLWPDRPA